MVNIMKAGGSICFRVLSAGIGIGIGIGMRHGPVGKCAVGM